MTNDRELLELAAKAAGVEFFYSDGIESTRNTLGFQIPWNPLTDDGDALRLAVKLNLWVDVDRPTKSTRVLIENGEGKGASEEHDDDPYAATRRAIVRAAAEIGKETK